MFGVGSQLRRPEEEAVCIPATKTMVKTKSVKE